MKKPGAQAQHLSRLAKEIMTVAEVAQYLRCHESTIYRLLKREELPAFRIGSDWRFLRPDIDRWISNSKTHSLRPHRAPNSPGGGRKKD